MELEIDYHYESLKKHETVLFLLKKGLNSVLIKELFENGNIMNFLDKLEIYGSIIENVKSNIRYEKDKIEKCKKFASVDKNGYSKKVKD